MSRKSERSGRKPWVVQVRGDQTYKEWVDRIADGEKVPVSKLIDRVLRDFAREKGYPEPPPR